MSYDWFCVCVSNGSFGRSFRLICTRMSVSGLSSHKHIVFTVIHSTSPHSIVLTLQRLPTLVLSLFGDFQIRRLFTLPRRCWVGFRLAELLDRFPFPISLV